MCVCLCVVHCALCIVGCGLWLCVVRCALRVVGRCPCRIDVCVVYVCVLCVGCVCIGVCVCVSGVRALKLPQLLARARHEAAEQGNRETEAANVAEQCRTAVTGASLQLEEARRQVPVVVVVVVVAIVVDVWVLELAMVRVFTRNTRSRARMHVCVCVCVCVCVGYGYMLCASENVLLCVCVYVCVFAHSLRL